MTIQIKKYVNNHNIIALFIVKNYIKLQKKLRAKKKWIPGVSDVMSQPLEIPTINVKVEDDLRNNDIPTIIMKLKND